MEEDEMGAGGWDSGRWVAGLAGAVFQVGATVLAGAAISEVVSEGPPSPVEPAGYAFGVWAVISRFLKAATEAANQHAEKLVEERQGPRAKPGA